MRPQWGLSACHARLTLLVSIMNPKVGSRSLQNLNDLVLGFANMVTQLFGMGQREGRRTWGCVAPEYGIEVPKQSTWIAQMRIRFQRSQRNNPLHKGPYGSWP